MLLCDGGIIGLEHLPEAFPARQSGKREVHLRGAFGSGTGSFLSVTLREGRRRLVEDYEREYLTHVLKRTRGNVGETARIAGVDPRTLYNKMKLLGLRKESFRKPPMSDLH